MAYVPNNQLTNSYIQSLITRANFQDVTSQYYDPQWIGIYYVVRDLNGNDSFFDTNRAGVRDFCIQQYVIQQNS